MTTTQADRIRFGHPQPSQGRPNISNSAAHLVPAPLAASEAPAWHLPPADAGGRPHKPNGVLFASADAEGQLSTFRPADADQWVFLARHGDCALFEAVQYHKPPHAGAQAVRRSLDKAVCFPPPFNTLFLCTPCALVHISPTNCVSANAPRAHLQAWQRRGLVSFAKCGYAKWYMASLPSSLTVSKHGDDGATTGPLSFMLDDEEDEDEAPASNHVLLEEPDHDGEDNEDVEDEQSDDDGLSTDDVGEDDDDDDRRAHVGAQNDADADEEHVRGHTVAAGASTRKRKRGPTKKPALQSSSARVRGSSIDALLAMESVGEGGVHDDDDEDGGEDGTNDEDLLHVDDDDDVEDADATNAIQQFIASTLKDAVSDT